FGDCNGMADYINQKIKVAQQLKAVDSEVNDGVLAALIFASLPSDYKPLIMALENCGSVITTDLVKERLLAEAAKVEKAAKEVALVSKWNGKCATASGSSGSTRKFKGTCNFCGKVGHKAKFCWSKKKGDGNHHSGLMTLEMNSKVLDTNAWYIDSGASVPTFNVPKRLVDQRERSE